MNTTVLAGPNILPEDYVEMLVLSIIIFFGIILNTGVFVQLMRQSKTPTASTSFLTGPYQVSSFTLFKVHLCITDFGIVLVHALIKLSWLYTGSWMLGGEAGCKIYQFLSAFTYYANSNVIVSIGLDRLKVVYTSHIQGAASVRRVRLMLAVSWAFAALCALPQLYVWEITMIPGYPQCTTIWMVHEYREQMTDFLKTTLVLYEMSHQFVVFWLPFVTLLGSYIFIVVRVVYYTLQPSGSSSGHHCGNRGRPRSLRKRLLGVLPNSSEQRLVSSTDSIHGEYYQFSYATTGDRTEMTRVTPSPSLRFGNGSIESRKGFWRLPFFRRHCDCLLGGETFAERVIEKRKTAVCFGSVRACCLNAEVSGPSFRPLGIQKKTPSSSPVWRRQLRSRIFITALAIVTTHFFLWLPYNLLNTARFVHEDAHLWMTSWGANLLEDLIVLNSVLNPILYAYEKKR